MSSILQLVNEKGNLPLTVNVIDKNGDAVVPTAMTWTLSTYDGVILNNQEDVEIETPDSTVDITLAGDDLEILDDANRLEYRLFTVNTDLGDPAIPEVIEVEFYVKNLRAKF